MPVSIEVATNVTRLTRRLPEGLMIVPKEKIAVFVGLVLLMVFMAVTDVRAIDSEATKQTIHGLRGVSVVVEELQPNLQKYAARFGLTQEQLRKDVEQTLAKSGMASLSQDKWLATPGRPMLYVSINTHEYEKYWFAYNVRIELRQLVSLEANPALKTMAATWGVHTTGVSNIGTLGAIRNNVNLLVERFAASCRSPVKP